MKWLSVLIMSYFKDINNRAPVDDEELQYMCNKLIEDIQETLNARKDFKKEDTYHG